LVSDQPLSFLKGIFKIKARLREILPQTNKYLNRESDLTFRIYPNPASDILFFKNKGQKTPLHMEIFDLRGKLDLQMSLSPEVLSIVIHELSVGFHVIKSYRLQPF